MPLLLPLLIGGSGVLALGGTAGFLASKGTQAATDGIKWLVIGAGVLGAGYLLLKHR